MDKKGISIVIFGITGDLARQKLVPALFELFTKGELPENISLIGYGRKEFSPEEFRSFLSPSIDARSQRISPSKKEQQNTELFLQLWKYIQGELDDAEGFKRLVETLSERSLFYLGMAPSFHTGIIQNLSRAQALCPKSQILIEKPFGESALSAERFEKKLLEHVREDQIYRIDHYLAKQGIIDLISLRKNDSHFEDLLSNEYVQKIEAKVTEQRTVGKRGAFYDSVGALRDIGQNHLLQMIATMISSKNATSSGAIRASAARSKAISSFGSFVRQERAQYEGYRQEEGVKADSMTDTLFFIEFSSDIPKWRGVQLIISGGKGMMEDRSEIVVTFRKKARFNKNKRMIKKLVIPMAGFGNAGKKLSRSRSSSHAYERIFLSALEQDRLYFASLDEAILGWKFVEAIERNWRRSGKITFYPVGSAVDF